MRFLELLYYSEPLHFIQPFSLTFVALPSIAKNYTYNAENKIVTAGTAAGIAYYYYNGEGQRVKISGTVVNRKMVYNADGKLIAEYSNNGSLIKEYFYRGGELLATIDAGGTVKFGTADHLGTVREWTQMDGSLVIDGTHDYTPFGFDLYYGSQHDGQRQQFVGYERDLESGLDFAQARYYAAIQGRFTSVDPYDPLNSGDDIASRDYYILQPQNWNRYAYALNNPHKYVDPDGKNPLLTAAIGFVSGAAVGAGLEAAKAIYRGESLTDAKVLQKIGAKALNGAIVGGVTGLTGNLAAGQAAAALALGSIAGGVAERAVDGNEQTQALSASSIAIDGASGFAGGYAAQKALAYAGDLTYAMRQGAYESYASISGSLFKSLEKPYLQSALNTFKYTFNVGIEQKVQSAVRSAAKTGTTLGLTQLQVLYLQYETAKRGYQESNAGEGKVTKLCDPKGNNCTPQ